MKQSDFLSTPKVLREDIDQMRVDLSEWMVTADFARIELKFREKFAGYQFFNQAGLTFLREAYMASVMARGLGFANVRLSNKTEDAPDFFLKDLALQYDVEMVEVLEDGRKRGAEPWDSSAITSDPVENWIRRAEQIPSQLRNAVIKKRKKNYSDKNFCLAIYLNIGDWGIRQTEIENCFHENTAIAKDDFLIVWLVWKDKLFELWRDGTQVWKTYNIN